MASALGWLGIGGILRGATASLEAKSAAEYQGQSQFDEWRAAIPYPWIPLYKGPPPADNKSSK